MQDSADLWLDFFQEALLYSYSALVTADMERSIRNSEDREERFTQLAEDAKELADIGLDQYQKRWPGL